ncbi:(d)CMP kinase [Spiroplasma endosymbiont of Virgichneumon dumeticola]|uniref:(d)CMP kinase n=1 Tax=Spiroplasma endosymbiont of Virgichneumon dumeticola TaxID=3139323 RepID=UPI0035C8EC2C
MIKKINIAIDGPAASGKSATAASLAKKIDYDYMDTGIMYRSFTDYCLKKQIPLDNEDLIIQALALFEMAWVNGHFLFNGQPIVDEIYSANVTKNVPKIAALPEVRKIIVKQIQDIVKTQGFIVVGRDIASVVLPDAQLKIFLTSSLHARSIRRYKQYIKEGINIKQEQVYEDMLLRDNTDKNRSTGQLIIVEDAKVLDNSEYDLQVTVAKLTSLYHNYFSHNKSK